MIKNYSLLIPSLLVTAMLSACGGGSSNNNSQTHIPPTTPTQSFQSSFITTLIINEQIEDTIQTYKIENQITTEKDQQHAYTVITELGNTLETSEGSSGTIIYPRLNQILRFELEKDKLILEIAYDPLLKEVNQFSIIKVDPNSLSEQLFRCDGEQFNEVCKTISIIYDNKTAKVDLTFNKAKFKSSTGSDHTLILDGKLQGDLSIAPQTVQNIPKVSQGSVTIDNQTHQIISATHTPEKREGANFFNEGVSVLLDNGNNISFTKGQEGLHSKYVYQDTNSSHVYLEETQNLSSKTIGSALQFSLIPSIFKADTFGEALRPSFIISGQVQVPLAKQSLSYSPKPSLSPTKDKDNPWYANSSYFNSTTVPDNFNIRLINHDTVEVENNNLIAIIENNKIKSIKLNDFLYSYGMELITIDYQCGDIAPACKGISIEPNGFGVKFNNTILTNLDPEDDSSENPLPSAITLNGGLVYLGR